MPRTAYTDLKDGFSQLRREITGIKAVLAIRQWEKAEGALKYQVALRRFEATLNRYVDTCRKAGFNLNQPRVPTGNREGGQWTTEGGSDASASSVENILRRQLADASDVLRAQVLTDATPDPIIPDARYAQVSVSRFDKTGEPQIDQMTDTFMQALTRAHTSLGEGAGPVYGIMIHGVFGQDVKAQNLPGISVEQSFSLGDVARYGLDGSIRTDVILRDVNSPTGRPVAIWDVKTGTAKLDGPRVQEIRRHVDVGPEVPVIELHIRRGITNKGWTRHLLSFAVISARVWASESPDNWDQEAIH